MKTETTATICLNILILLPGALLSSLMMLGGGGFVSSDVFLFSFMTFLASLAVVFTGKSAIFKPARMRSTYRHLSSRKNLTHRNDPLLM